MCDNQVGGGKLSISGGRCLRGGNGDMWKVSVCHVFVLVGEFPAPLFAFSVFLCRNGHFCAHVSLKRHANTAHKLVCVRVIGGKGEGGRCQNKKRL